MSSDIFLSIILPAYNEEGAILATLEKLKALKLPDAEIIVVDDGSKDRTAELARSAGVRVIAHPYNIGNGAAVKTGIRNANGRVLAFMDADGQHSPEDLVQFLPLIANYHMVVGARTRASDSDWHRDIANIVYNRFASFVANFAIKDLTSGFRIMRRNDALRFVDIFPNGFSYPTTSTLAFIRSGRTVKYMPIAAKRRIGTSKIKPFRDGPLFLLIIVKIAMSFSPLRVFIPVSFTLFLLGCLRYLHTYLQYGKITNFAHLLINSSLIIFMLGLIAEQIAMMRLEKGDNLYRSEDQVEIERYFKEKLNSDSQ
jgi:glycosyltransferase involved in cell wall biosynthesis